MQNLIVIGYRPGLDAAASARGLHPFHLVDRPRSALAGRPHAVVGDLENAQEALRAVSEGGLTNVVGVVTAHEKGVFPAAVLRGALDLPGDRSLPRVVRFRDKLLQERALAGSVRHAQCRRVRRGTTFDELAAALGAPFIVKPADGSGSKGTAKVATEAKWRDHVGPDGPASDMALVAESYQVGEELHLDGAWRAGRLEWACASRYLASPMEYHAGNTLSGVLISPSEEPTLYEEMLRCARAALAALGTPDSVFHLEFFHDSGALTFGECAVRVGGAKVPEVVRLTYGVDLYDLQVALSIGADLPSLPPAVAPTTLFGYALLRRHTAAPLTGDDFRKRFTFDEFSWDDDPRARLGAYGRVGHCIMSADDGATLAENLRRVVRFSETGEC